MESKKKLEQLQKQVDFLLDEVNFLRKNGNEKYFIWDQKFNFMRNRTNCVFFMSITSNVLALIFSLKIF